MYESDYKYEKIFKNMNQKASKFMFFIPFFYKKSNIFTLNLPGFIKKYPMKPSKIKGFLCIIKIAPLE